MNNYHLLYCHCLRGLHSRSNVLITSGFITLTSHWELLTVTTHGHVILEKCNVLDPCWLFSSPPKGCYWCLSVWRLWVEGPGPPLSSGLTWLGGGQGHWAGLAHSITMVTRLQRGGEPHQWSVATLQRWWQAIMSTGDINALKWTSNNTTPKVHCSSYKNAKNFEMGSIGSGNSSV